MLLLVPVVANGNGTLEKVQAQGLAGARAAVEEVQEDPMQATNLFQAVLCETSGVVKKTHLHVERLKMPST